MHDDSSRPDEVAAEVARRLARYRAELMGGRGPGASEDELARHMSYRPTLGGQPSAISRELLHLRTDRARGVDPALLSWERDWARPLLEPFTGRGYQGPDRAEEVAVTGESRPHHHDGLLRRAGQLLVLAAIRRLHSNPREQPTTGEPDHTRADRASKGRAHQDPTSR